MTETYKHFDLHCHSTESDGELSPSELVERAAEHGVEVLALTDHDTFSGYAEASARAEGLGVKVISGIEFSCQWGKQGVHIVGLNFDVTSPVMKTAQHNQLEVRRARAAQIAHKLVAKGLPDLLEAACQQSPSGIPGRPHFAQVMVAQGLVKDEHEAFKRYLGRGKAGDIQALWPDLETVIAWLVSAGGIAVIAHPCKYDMSRTKLRELIAEFKSLGGGAMEVVTSGQKQGEQGMLADLCRRFGLLASVGSDFHSPRFKWAEIGRVDTLPASVDPVWSAWAL
ncbi:MAG: PHP domain-containing protein [Oleiphilaceae bacterium]|nr:PHP domain-containing protein [Oleiphilaceae bacterium]